MLWTCLPVSFPARQRQPRIARPLGNRNRFDQIGQCFRKRRAVHAGAGGGFLFAALLALNDVENTELIASVIADMDYSTHILGFEAKRDLSDSWTATVEAAVMLDVDEKDVIHDTRRDGYVLLNATYSF